MWNTIRFLWEKKVEDFLPKILYMYYSSDTNFATLATS